MTQQNPYQSPHKIESDTTLNPFGRVFAIVSVGFIVLVPLLAIAGNILFEDEMDSLSSHALRAVICFAIAYAIWRGSNVVRVLTAMLSLLFAGLMAYLVCKNGLQLSSQFVTFAFLMVGAFVTGLLLMLPATKKFLNARRR